MANPDSRIGAAIAAATCSLLGTAATPSAHAQEAPRQWDIDSAALYYGESGGRVQDASIAVDAARDLGDDRALNLSLHLDTLTGASPNGAIAGNGVQTFTSPSGRSTYRAAGGEIPLDTSFHDTRFAADVGWSQPLGRLYKMTAGMSLSTEFDYQHIGGSFGLARDFDRRNTTLSASLAYGQDSVKPIGGIPLAFTEMPDSTGRGDEEGGASAPNRTGGSDSKTVMDVLLGVTQVLGRHSLLRLNYSYSDSNGYLTDPYKILSVVDPLTGELVARSPAPGTEGPGGVYLFERRPDSRRRQGLYAEYRQDFGGSVLALDYRYSTDDWNIDSHTVEARLRWPLGDSSYFEPHLRYYTQTAASFYRYSLASGAPMPEFASADARLGALDTATLGFKYGHRLPGGNEWSARLEFYRETGTVAAAQLIGDQRANPRLPDFNAVILQVSYRFRL